MYVEDTTCDQFISQTLAGPFTLYVSSGRDKHNIVVSSKQEKIVEYGTAVQPYLCVRRILKKLMLQGK